MKFTHYLLSSALLLATTSLFAAKAEVAIFAGGCFWSMQHDFDKLPGVIKTTVGYTGGKLSNPTYQQVSRGDTGHYESIEVEFDPSKVSYQQLLDFYWHDIDPTDPNGQFCDHGAEYHSVIFYRDAAQKKMAEQSKLNLIQSQRFDSVMTKIMPAQTFYPAEGYHQKYSDKNPEAYDKYRRGCGRDAKTREIWKAK